MAGFRQLLRNTPQGLYCPPGDFHIDPVAPVARAIVTHGHSDHARSGHGKRSGFYSDYTFGVWREDANGERLLTPVGKAYFGFTDEELRWLDKWVRDHTTKRFGPVREVEHKLVLEVAFDGIARSTRHKSGVALRFPRISRIRTDKPAAEADTVDNLLRLLETAALPGVAGNS